METMKKKKKISKLFFFFAVFSPLCSLFEGQQRRASLSLFSFASVSPFLPSSLGGRDVREGKRRLLSRRAGPLARARGK